jgi:glc operon protein GlcG
MPEASRFYNQWEDPMVIGTLHVALLSAAAAFAVTAAQAQTSYEGNGQVPQKFVVSGKAADRLHDHISINADTAERLSKACEDIAKKNNSQVVVIVLDPQGLVVHEHRMDGEGWIQVTATEQKARTALRTRTPSHVLTNRNINDPFTNGNMAGYGLTTQEGGLPIIVNGQLIGAIGVGGIPPAERNATYGEEMCARDALEQVIGPQPPLLPEITAQRAQNPAGTRGAAANR